MYITKFMTRITKTFPGFFFLQALRWTEHLGLFLRGGDEHSRLPPGGEEIQETAEEEEFSSGCSG
jgi:hypothetical protein